MKLISLILVAVLSLALLSGCGDKHHPDHRFSNIVAIYYNGTSNRITQFDFLQERAHKERVLLKLYPERSAKLYADVPAGQSMYVIAKEFFIDDYKQKQCTYLEIHYRTDKDIAGGTMDLGKFGKRKIHILH